MSDRWKLEIKDLNREPSVLYAEPNMEIMTKFVSDAVNELTRRCALAEEKMIFRSCSSEVLKRVISVCESELSSRVVEGE